MPPESARFVGKGKHNKAHYWDYSSERKRIWLWVRLWSARTLGAPSPALTTSIHPYS